MNPQELFCPNIDCPARGQIGKGNIGIHHLRKKRGICHVCQKTFTTTRGTLFYRLRTNAETVMLAITLLAYGCPIQAIVKAFGLDERTVRDWWRRSGAHCRAVHAFKVERSHLDLQQVQADEIKAKRQEGHFWMALAMMVPTRLWLGGVVSEKRDLELIQTLSDKIKGMALCRPLLLL
jgi:transposase-like protein